VSDSAQILVAIDCPPEEAPVYGEAVLGWLVEHGVVEREVSDCVLGGDGRGYPPGPELDTAVEGGVDVTRGLWTNGLAIVVGRTVFDGGANGVELRCPRCAATFEPQDDWFEAAASWAEGDDGARYSCPSCGLEQTLPEWTGPWPWGFGHLGLEFWNWPPLRREFVDELSELLPGRLLLVHQHL
jgi:hypothetical protein